MLSDSTTEERKDGELKRDVSEGGGGTKGQPVVSAADHATGGI